MEGVSRLEIDGLNLDDGAARSGEIIDVAMTTDLKKKEVEAVNIHIFSLSVKMFFFCLFHHLENEGGRVSHAEEVI